MSNKGKGKPKVRRLSIAAHGSCQSKAAIVVNVQNHNVDVHASIFLLRDSVASLLASDNSTKQACKEMLNTTNTHLTLQGDVKQKIPELIPSTCTKYAVNCLQSDSNYEKKTHGEVTQPCDNMRVRYFMSQAGQSISLRIYCSIRVFRSVIF